MLEINQDVSQSAETMTSLSGEQISIATPGKAKLVYFFAPWCQVCNFSIDNLESFHQQGLDIEVYAIALDYENEDAVKQFVSRHELSFPILLGDNQMKHRFKIKGYPSYYLVDKHNKVVAKSMGYSTEVGMLARTLLIK
ncbi:TlpA family protein disulfide reductase [Thalassotalea agarivorans]|nr:TlpA disulfide reductase family protein [Thalassotalea agarivorans]